MRTADIRSRFLDFFAARGHTVVPSAPLPTPDPTLLFVNAGMVPFKPYFAGEAPPPWERATSVQKCVRTLDIEEVGRTTRHGSFFQMNGNFSFGDYFKEEAVAYAWELSTSPQAEGGYGLDPARIWVTVHHSDTESRGIWRRVAGLPDERIVDRGDEDNFWSMGVPGPCGPCSELYYDRGPAFGREGGPAVDEDRYMEFWNLVFMQYERGAGPGKSGYPILGELPRRNIDTGMGLERMATLLQGVDNLYEIDETRPVLQRAAELAGVRYGADPEADVRLRVVADHVRTGLMLQADGTAPGNEGRGYVLRRILRRAVRSMRLLGYEDPALAELLPVARDCMAPSYPEVADAYPRIAEQAGAEEDAFRSSLRQGTTVLDTAVARVKESGGRSLPGAQAFLLHDTYGFPIDLTLEMAAEQGVEVDREGFTALMNEQRERARADARARKAGGAVDTTALRTVLDTHGPTDWRAWDTLETESRVIALLGPAGPVPVARTGDVVTVVLDRTPFYAESGGQESDAGVLSGASAEAEVLDVQRPLPGLVAHQVRVTAGELALDDTVHAAVDAEWRLGARQAHSGTHVLHAALREVLGPNALQSGSYNRPGHLRLDFPWRGALSTTARSEIEEAANRALRRDLPVGVRWMTLPEAKEIGALALFDETYGEKVRVVEIGGAWSRELCGGTHVDRAAQIGTVALTSEGSVGAGMRRLEAAVGIEGFGYLARERDLVARIADQLGAPRAELPDRIAGLLDRLKAADRENARLKQQATSARAGDLAGAAADVNGVRTVTTTVSGTAQEARALALAVRDRLPADAPGAVAVGTEDGALVLTLNARARQSGLNASDLVKRLLDGRGGGSPETAQGGGLGREGVTAALTALPTALAAG
ncbi:alanine--tRNA ligase [Streptomyces californicus]|uniref:Alanine--tRNA ligase n=1 Tax=Streptomyces californicus TaxID=67351 RepID=A0ABD7D2M8_9ACTN|nr:MULTISPECIES: alanine--tRNA ligase [Streptomyces]QRV29062.1 alanine--tRNA ligase [Streptomyces californicus]QRV35333.1 alanine--tRNA ligase [Streptomyces californicus]QRV42476.1 alanine--tRNA ligase [Streptomyces californicus]QRV49157.1 alanine--tRNA ligase [Streptomyces californicus]